MSVGVVIGRFQVANLHAGHLDLINQAIKANDKVLVFLGVPARISQRNPMDFETRERMVRSSFPDDTLVILPLADQPTDAVWSKALDAAIKMVHPYDPNVTLYGGRDSFLSHYLGKHDMHHIDQVELNVSGTAEREAIGRKVLQSPNFRAGVVYHSQNTPVRPTLGADVAMTRPDGIGGYQVLLGRKSWDETGEWGFPGGKAEVTDDSVEYTARRELREETGMSVEGKLHYISSYTCSDWRNAGNPDLRYLSVLYHAEYSFGLAKGSDDLEEVKWFDVAGINICRDITPCHRTAYNDLVNYLKSYSANI